MNLDSVFFTLPYLWISALVLFLLELALLWVKEKHGFLMLTILVLFSAWLTMALLNGLSLLEGSFVAMAFALPLLWKFLRSLRE